MILPFSSTRMRSARRTVLKRCEMKMADLPAVNSRKRANTSYSACGSSELVALIEPLAQHRIVGVGQPLDHRRRAALGRRRADILVVVDGLDVANADIARRRKVVGNVILEDHADLCA